MFTNEELAMPKSKASEKKPVHHRFKRNQKGLSIIELALVLIVTALLAAAAFATLAFGANDGKAESLASSLEGIRNARETLVIKGTTAQIAAYNALTGPADAANLAIVRQVLGPDWSPKTNGLALADLCNSAVINPNIKDRVRQSLGNTGAIGNCGDITGFVGAGYAQNQTPLPSNTGGAASPFFAVI